MTEQAAEKGKPGRKPGGMNRLNRTVKEAFEHAFHALQENKYNIPGISLEDWAMKNPTEFYRMATKLIPTKLEGNLDAAVALTVVTGVPSKPKPADDFSEFA